MSSREIISDVDFTSLIEEAYSGGGIQPEIARQYARRLSPWLRFSGFLEFHGERIKRPEGEFGKDIGVFVDRSSPKKKGWGMVIPWLCLTRTSCYAC